MDNIGIIGYKGRLGTEFIRRGYQQVDCDITDSDSIKAALEGKNFNCIVNCAAYSEVDNAEAGRITAYAVNTFGPNNLAKIFPGYIIHLSTDYIFDGISGPYDEGDYAAPINAYGFTKYFGEVGLRLYLERVLIVRTTILYDAGPKPNFVLAVYNQLNSGKVVKAPKSLIGNPTYVAHLVDGIEYCIGRNVTGILNIAGKTLISRFDLAREIARFFNFSPEKVVNSPAWGEAHRPERCGLILDQAKELGVPLYSLWEGLDAFQKSLEGEKVLESA